ncbi:MAG: Hsp20/alpha crystallin family protein, partial [Succiniclasticum sp.]|nr:Hsp20/alpha crystallin family protein [Succiniclasticum sp.]
MRLPSIFTEGLFDDWMNDNGLMNPTAFLGRGDNPLYGKHAANIMKTDIREKEDSYEVAVDLPGFKKEG